MTGQTPALPAGWSLDGDGRCRSCGAPVLWAVFDKSGKRAPFDADGKSHFSSCPQAAQWRRPRS